MDVSKTVTYIETYGDAIMRARLACILWGDLPSRRVMLKLNHLQRADGGFAYRAHAGDHSSIFDTVYVMSWIDDFDLHQGKLVDRAITYLMQQQQADGGWDEPEKSEVIQNPDWLKSGALETQVWLTAYCSHWLLQFGYLNTEEKSRPLLEFLKNHQTMSGRLYGYLRATWEALPLFAAYDSPSSASFSRALHSLESEFEPHRFSEHSLITLLQCLRDAGLKDSQSLVSTCLQELTKRQSEDGSWQDEENGIVYPVSTSVDALRTLKDFSVI